MIDRPQSLTLVRLRGHDYGQDVGNAHVNERAWHLFTLDTIAFGCGYIEINSLDAHHIPHSRIGRYLDGEEEVEGTYR